MMVKRKHETGSLVACSRRGTRKKELPHLPREVIFNILILLPAEFLHRKGKYVCKTWADIICDSVFIKTHLLHSNPGLLIQETVKPPFNARYLQSNLQGKIKVSCLKIPFPRDHVIASCEGLLLSYLRGVLYVANSVTMQGFKLPDIPCKHRMFISSSIACIPHSGDFKVILPCVGSDGFCHWHVLTVNTDLSWRKIDSGLKEDAFKSFIKRPISIKGVIYWTTHTKHCFDTSFLAVDLRDESIHCVRVPKEFLIKDLVGLDYVSRARGLVKMDNYLACIVRGAKNMELNVWVLNDLHTSDWENICKLDIKAGSSVSVWDHKYVPIVWLPSGPVLVFTNWNLNYGYLSTSLVAYNLTTGVMKIIKIADISNYFHVLEHTNSLLLL